MSSYKPSAPPYHPNTSSSSSPNPYNYSSNNTTNNNNYSNYNPSNYSNYNNPHNSNYPPPAGPGPAQSYHVGHQPQPYPPPPSSTYGQSNYDPFPPGTDPEIIRSFEAVDRDRSGYVEDYELQNALSSGYHRFNLRTVRLLISLFRNPNQNSPRIGRSEFAALWRCLGEWRAIFAKFDRDRSGKIDAGELKDALHSLGYAVPPSVLRLLISYYDDGRNRQVVLDFDSFVECGMIIKGLTEKFKEKDTQYTGSATIAYDDFMSMVLPFLVTYN